MDENSLRSAIGAIASDLEPPTMTTIDINAARRRGRRRQWASRTAAPLAIALAVAMALTVPRALPSTGFAANRGQVTAAGPPLRFAPVKFDPLVQYADFGWLPPGFTEPAMPFEISVAPHATAMTTEAHSRNEDLSLTVYPRGQCRAPDIKGPGSCFTSGSESFTRLAPLNGRPAWGQSDKNLWASLLIWEYAPGAFASLSGSMFTLTPTPTLNLASPPLAQLREIAARVKFGQLRPMLFPFRLTGGLPVGWQVMQADETLSKSGGGCTMTLSVGRPASGQPLLTLMAWSQISSCQRAPVVPPGPQYPRVTKFGVSWWALDSKGKFKGQDIIGGPAAATAGLRLEIVTYTPSLDAFEVFHRMKLFGTNSANWTTSPLG